MALLQRLRDFTADDGCAFTVRLDEGGRVLVYLYDYGKADGKADGATLDECLDKLIAALRAKLTKTAADLELRVAELRRLVDGGGT